MDEELLKPPIITIWTGRLQLQTVTMDALDDIMSFITRMDVMKWTSVGPVSSKQQGEKWLSARCLGPEAFNFAVRERDLSSTASSSSSSLSSPSSNEAVKPRIIGLFGSFHWPSCGYMLHPDYYNRGYATEGMKAFIPAYFERVPPASEGGTGHDVIDAYVDAENVGSMRVLEKCGFARCELLEREFESPVMGLRNTVVYRMARPGKTLAELGFGEEGQQEEAPVPPVQ
ncbi:putative GNAT domain, acyl-CoA N-acyltransferase [Septoria linicola]|nr:putative GNAT domain, acyl-CoA N-acyltransferase [Septoria linicola]